MLAGFPLTTQVGDAIAGSSAVQFVSCFPGALGTDPAALAITAHMGSPQPWGHISELGDLHLQTGLATAGVSTEDFQNYATAIENLDASGILQVAQLCGCHLGIEDDNR